MKKLFTSLTAVLMAVTAFATDYKDVLSVTIDSEATTPVETIISVDKNSDGTYNLGLKNFILYMGSDMMPIGSIFINNVEATDNNGVTTLKSSQYINIENGDIDGIPLWYGPNLGAVPVNMTGALRGDKFYTVININFMGMNIKVVFGNGGYQIPNSDFELFHTAKYINYKKDEFTSDEPNSWHSFMSASGMLASAVSINTHTYISDDVRPGSTGNKSVKVVSAIVLGFQPANGTLTTGRLAAGGFTATDTKNNSFLDMSKDDVDGNGDPFYTIINGQPDALKVWVKFKQGTLDDKNKDYKYATVSAVITDGTYYQDPEDKEYTNVVAKAQNAKIESNDFAWQEITVPFDYATYATNNAETKAILVTLSTNAQPGVASKDAKNPDELYIDDFSLIYNSKLASLKVKGADVENFDKDTKTYTLTSEGTIDAEDIEAVADGKGAYVTKQLENVDGGVVATITVTSNDLKETNVYTLNINGTTTGISKTQTTAGNSTAKIYNVNGQRVNDMNRKGLYIIHQADGKTVKVMKK